MIGAVERWRERTEGTVLITTHDIKLARELGEHLAILGNGRIVSSGDASELLDGVDSSDAFDRRFAVSDLWGPLDMNEVQRSLDEDDDDSGQRGFRFQYSPQLTLMVAAAIVIMIMVFVTAKMSGVLLGHSRPGRERTAPPLPGAARAPNVSTEGTVGDQGRTGFPSVVTPVHLPPNSFLPAPVMSAAFESPE